MRRSIIALTTACLAGFAGTAGAEAPPAPDTVQIVVPVTRSDLESAPAVAALYQRVREAARSVCAEAMADVGVNRSSPYASVSDCRAKVLEQAVANAPYDPLKAYYAQTRGPDHRATEVASR